MALIETSHRAQPVALNFEPMAPMEQQQQDATVDGDGLSLYELEKFLLDIRDEPEWRSMANRCADYYDHNQLNDEVLADFRRRGLPPLVINLIHPTVNTVLGMEAKTRTDWKVDWEDEENEEVALAVGKKMTEAERMSQADRAISDAYAGQIKAGMGWVEVNWHPDPFAYRYRARSVHRREIWWDWRKREVEDWRYLVRKRRYDADHLRSAFPKLKSMFDSVLAQGLTWQEYATRLNDVTGLGQFMDIERAMTLEEQDWIDRSRNQISVFEVWYRQFVRGYVARVGETVIEIDQANPRHMLAIGMGKITPVLASYPKLRQALFVGPHRVFDRATPFPHRKIPYVPFFGYREDLTGAPYGLIRGMLSSQDEINARRSKSLALLNSRRGEVDSDALDTKYNTHEDAADEVSRHDSYLVLNPKRLNRPNGVKISDNQDLAQGQAQILQESKNEIHQTSGVFPPMAGDNKSSMSGLAIHSLVEQGTQTLAEINDNYTWARREVGDLEMELVKHDTVKAGQHSVGVGEGKARKTIVLNESTWDNNLGEQVTKNNVATAVIKLVLDDVPSTPAWRQQQSAQLAEITKSLPPALQAFVVPFYIEATDLRDRKKIGSLLRKQMGIPEDGADAQQQPQIPAEIQQQLQDQAAAIQDLTQKADAAMQEAAKLKLENTNKQGEQQLKERDLTQRAAAETDKRALEREKMQAEERRAAAERAATAGLPPVDPKTIVSEVVAALEPTLEETSAAVRELAADVDQRFADSEKAAKEEAAKREKDAKEQVAREDREAKERAAREKTATAATAPAQPSVVFEAGAIQVINQPASADKTITLDTPDGPITASVKATGKPKPGAGKKKE